MGDRWVVLRCTVAGEIFDMRGFNDEGRLGITRLIFNAQGRILGENGNMNKIAQGCTKGVEAVWEKRYWVVEW